MGSVRTFLDCIYSWVWVILLGPGYDALRRRLTIQVRRTIALTCGVTIVRFHLKRLVIEDVRTRCVSTRARAAARGWYKRARTQGERAAQCAERSAEGREA